MLSSYHSNSRTFLSLEKKLSAYQQVHPFPFPLTPGHANLLSACFSHCVRVWKLVCVVMCARTSLLLFFRMEMLQIFNLLVS